MPTNSASTPLAPARLSSAGLTPKPVAMMAKSRSMAPPRMPMPDSSGMSTRPFCPPVYRPPT
ncbi:hypothetical protein D3C78_1379920 [compost metagenome]